MSLNLNAPSYSVPVAQGRYLPTSSRAQIVTVLLIIGAVMSLLSCVISLIEMSQGELFTDEGMDEPLTLVLALLVIGLGLLSIIVYVATAVLFLMWLYRAHENLQAFGVPKHQLQYSSGWAVGSFFVPIVGLIIPYRAIRELWSKSVPHSSSMFSDLSPPGFFPVWWGFWILSNITDQVYFRLSFRTETPTEVIAPIGLVSGILGMTAAFFAIKVVREIEKQQAENRRLNPGLSSFASPPAPPEFTRTTNTSATQGYTHESDPRN